ncbi:histone-fold-containing protein [Absidia repens]|uniref:Histone H2A n=1 Tax=Absidia repens TaxID=90262 RepID=A0A1X2IUI3_9FUNG|nr:histone-fold-containing protein [Absidia repens]
MSSQNNNGPDTATTHRKPRVSAQKRAGIHLPVTRITRLFREGSFASRYSVKASVYMAAVLEYLASELVDVAGCIALDEKKVVITPKHLLTGIQNDVALNQLMNEAPGGTQIAGAGWVLPLPQTEDDP